MADADKYEVRRWVRSQYLYANYCVWCRQFGEVAAPVRVFGETMIDMGFLRRRFPEGQGYLVYGISDEAYDKGTILVETPPAVIKRAEKVEKEFAESK